MTPLHICFLCYEYPPGRHGGVGVFTQVVARALASRDHLVHVLGLYPVTSEVREDDCGVRVLRIPCSRIRGLRILSSARRLQKAITKIAEERPLDILEGQENAFAFLSCTTPGRRILRMHGGHHFFHATLGQKPMAFRSWVEKRSFAKAQHLCAVSRFVADETRRLLRLGNTAIEVLPNPVDTQRFKPMPEVLVIPGRIAFVGTLCEKKGIRQLVQAMPEILSSVPGAHLVAYGRDWKDRKTGVSYLAGLKAATVPEIFNRIAFKGHCDNQELPAQLAAAQVLVYPSHMEAQGIVVIEGMAMGKTVLASQTGPGPELIEHGTSGLLCNPHEPHSIAESVIRCFGDPALASRLAAAARQRAVAEFSVQKLVVKNDQFYHRCLEGKTGD